MFAPLIVLLIVNGVISHITNSKPHYNLEQSEEYFKDFIVKYNKTYTKEEKEHRFATFKQNIEKIIELNEKSETAWFGVNQFADLTRQEFSAQYTGLKWSPLMSDTCEQFPQSSGAPEQFDWRSKNVVTPVKDQATCGSCWAFAATGAVESQYAIKYQQLLDLSEQELLDCDTQSKGCQGGYPASAFSYLVTAGQMSESQYPYAAVQGTCRTDPSSAQVKLSGCYETTFQDEESVKQALYNYGPIAYAIDSQSLAFYYGGILDQCESGPIDHAVLLVGFGTENGVPYWISKNSWTANWGEQGYFKIKRGVNACNMLSFPLAAPIVE